MNFMRSVGAPVGPSNVNGLIGRFSGQNRGGNILQRFSPGGLNPGQAPPKELNGPGPVAIDNGMSQGGIRPPRMPQVRPNPGMQNPGMQQPQYSPMMPSGAVINKFISPQPGAESMTPPASPGGYSNGSSPGGDMWTLPWQRRLF